jgi:hypothetical protein
VHSNVIGLVSLAHQKIHNNFLVLPLQAVS